ncbi:MAG: hypothetical protein PHU95_00745 [Candidatus Thermoplasmatota archaeon]|nr:hypothetical protein [Candidatus Thermoplasmatota archaeon]
MDFKSLAQKVKVLTAPVSLLFTASFGGTLGYYMGLWFDAALFGSGAPQSALIFAFLGFFGAGTAGLWLMGED